METSLISIVQQSNLDKAKTEFILQKFSDYSAIAEEWKQKASTLVVTNELQVDEMKMAREGRLVLKSKRVEIEKTRKELKEQSLREGKAIDGIAKFLTGLIEPIETYLDVQERFVEIQQAKIRQENKIKRETEIQPFFEFIPQPIDLGLMTESDYQKMFSYVKKQKQEKIETEQKAEAEKVAKEKAAAEERERIRIENEKLKTEALVKEKQLADERAKADAERKEMIAKAAKETAASDAKLKAIKEAKEKAEKELKAKADAEAKAKRDADAKAKAELKAKQLAEKKAAAAPDKEKLIAFANQLATLNVPAMKTDEGDNIADEIARRFVSLIKFINEQATNL